MASMNLLNIKKEIQNLNILVNHLKNENKDLKDKIEQINEEITDVKIKKPTIIEVVNFVDEIKEEMDLLSNKIDKINKKRFFKEIVSLDKYNETYNFLTNINIDEKTINVLLFLNYNTVADLCDLNLEDLILYNIDKPILEFIIKKACEKATN
jgi:predicted RNase H-like nuclease (RuvC/YqgF family)